jgi:hypothetical protein
MRPPPATAACGLHLCHLQEGQTIIRIPVSLSDVYKGTWSIDAQGKWVGPL